MPVTRTSVTVATATASWTMPERHVRVAASRTVFRRIGKPSTKPTLSERRSQPRPKRCRAAVRGVADVRPAEARVRDPADRDRPPTVGELGEERRARFDLGPRRRPVRALGARVRGHDVPEEDVALDPELLEHRVDDGRGRLGRPGAGELAFRGQGDARDARPAVAGRLGDEEELRSAPLGSDRRRGGLAGAAEPAYWLNVSPIVAAASRSTKPSPSH